ncbi:MAG: carboxylating nicotinate-nucleotide diphosphorylase [Bdellovibrionales bacterium]|nr:carboxylating nicotinate-nucleotide diphosphorylase [Bdellovibrionales bacterium]MCB0418734.1 carboxylating nicotinate-nucleotide diphosphorylase [Bdellovibrionales bacterium]
MVWNAEIEDLVRRTLAEDCVHDDVTTSAVLNGVGGTISAIVRTREAGVFSGEAVVAAFEKLTPLKIQCLVTDGAAVEVGQDLVRLSGTAADCLALERSLLNFLALACGIASKTRRFVEAAGPYPTKILATRKTLPGLRALQLLAVQHGGGLVHRRDLSDGILIKDNHLLVCELEEAVKRAQVSHSPLHRVEVEVDNLEQLRRVLALNPDVVMLDNFSANDLRQAMELVKGQLKVEVSGGIQLEDIPQLAAYGVDFISVGALTHTIKGLDLTLEVVQP